MPRCGAVFPTGLRKVATGLRKVALRCEMADRGTALRTRSKSLGGANCGRRRCRTRGWGRRRGLPWRGVASGITNARACILKHRAPERVTEAGPSLWGLYHAVCTESGRRGCQGRHHAWPPWTPWMPRAAPRLPLSRTTHTLCAPRQKHLKKDPAPKTRARDMGAHQGAERTASL